LRLYTAPEFKRQRRVSITTLPLDRDRQDAFVAAV
jgi:hypothetical protein